MAFFIATTLPTDAKLQREVRLLSKEHVLDGKFPIGLFFWEDLIQELILDKAEFNKHYPEFLLNKTGKDLFEVSVQPKQEKVIKHDRYIFKKGDDLLPERSLSNFLVGIQTDHSYYSDDAQIIDKFCYEMAEEQNIFLNSELKSKIKKLIDTLNGLRNYCATNFFDYPRNQKKMNMRMCLHPHWNVDREGTGDPQESNKYGEAAKELKKLIDGVSKAYSEYRRSIKNYLII